MVARALVAGPPIGVLAAGYVRLLRCIFHHRVHGLPSLAVPRAGQVLAVDVGSTLWCVGPNAGPAGGRFSWLAPATGKGPG